VNEMLSNLKNGSPDPDIVVFLGRTVRMIDISLELDTAKFRMRTYAGFKKDMQFETEVLKDYDDGGLKQLVRGVHMRLHAGSHVDAPSHMIKGGKDLHELDLNTFIGPAMVADIRHRGAKEAILPEDLDKSVGGQLEPHDRLLLRTDINKDLRRLRRSGWREHLI